MLHFLIGLALCIFIGERFAHYIGWIRRRREERRLMAVAARMDELLGRTAPPRIQASQRDWLFPVSVCVAMGLLVAAFAVGAIAH